MPQSVTITKKEHRDQTGIKQKSDHQNTRTEMEIKGTQQKLTFPLLAELTVMLPQLENELGPEQLHLGVWRKHF